MKLKVDQSNGTLCVCVDAAGCCVRFVGDHKREMGLLERSEARS